MKDSRIEWISGIPAEWNSKPIRYLFRHVTEKNIFGNEKTALKFTYGTIIPKSDFDADTDDYVANTILNYTLVRPGVIMINCLNLNYDFVSQRIGLVKDKGAITSAYLAIEPKEDVDSEYANYQLKYFDSIKAFHNMGTGVRKTLDFSELGKKYFILPSKTVQRKIVAYLNGKCAEIDSLHADIEKQIDVLEQYKKSVITEAVTKGLNPDVEMKDSGIEWIGKIPKDWDIAKIKFYFNVTLGKMVQPIQKSKLDTYDTYICAANVKWLGIDKSIKKEMWFSPYEKEVYLLEKGDVLVMEGGTAGTATIYDNEFYPCYMQNSVNRCRTKGNSLNKFLYYWLFFVFHVGYITSICNKATIMHYTKEKLENTSIVNISLNQQQQIVDFLDFKCAEIDVVIAEKKKQLETLEAYKKSLIYEYVTGKKEVPA